MLEMFRVCSQREQNGNVLGPRAREEEKKKEKAKTQFKKDKRC